MFVNDAFELRIALQFVEPVAESWISQIEPRIVVPMHYALPGQQTFMTDLAPLEKFTHELGLKDVVAEEKLSVTAANLPAEGEETRVVVMKRAE